MKRADVIATAREIVADAARTRGRWGLTDTQVIAGVLIEYRDELTKDACDQCDQCGWAVMCSFHSILSVLQGHTSLMRETETMVTDLTSEDPRV